MPTWISSSTPPSPSSPIACFVSATVPSKGATGLQYLPLHPKAEMSLIFAWKKYQKMTKAGQIFLSAAREELSTLTSTEL